MTSVRTIAFLRGRDAPTTADFKKGDRVQLHPATDLWARGARWGTVVTVGRSLIRVYVDRLDRAVNIQPVNLIKDADA